MGTVLLCEQTEPIRRRLAVKLIRLGMDSERIVQRFGHEREALELMEHPGIAQLLDAGISAEGRPYFAMEYVDGPSIADYCDGQALGVRERLKVLAMTLRALHHAHQRGILHRDLKPSNILVATVDGVAQPKIIDFGLARATDTGTEGSFVTRTGEILGTPAYMSPEQFRGGLNSVDIRSDIYSMGVLLFELLTGRLPVELGQESPVQALMLLTSRENASTPAPSSKVREGTDDSKSLARHRSSDPQSLFRALKGEVDWIVLRAMESSAERRYDSAAAFADDIEAFLRHRPIAAGPPEFSYRARKFLRRNRLTLGAATLVVLALLAGSVMSLLSARDARLGSKDVKVVDILHFGSQYAKENYGDRPKVLTIFMGSLGGNFRELGMYEEAEEHLRLALKFQLEADDTEHAKVAYKMNGLAILLKRIGKTEEAEELYRSAIERVSIAGDPAILAKVGVWQFNLGKLLSQGGDVVGAREVFEESLASHHKFAPENVVGLGLLEMSLAALDTRSGKTEIAELALRRALAHLEQADPPVPHIVFAAKAQLGDFLSQLGGDPAEAEELLLSALELRIEYAGANSPDLSVNLNALVRHYTIHDQPELARPYAEQAIELAEQYLSPDGIPYADALRAHGNWLGAIGNFEEATAELEIALDVFIQRAPEDDPRIEQISMELDALHERLE